MATILFAAYFGYFVFRAIKPEVWSKIFELLGDDDELK